MNDQAIDPIAPETRTFAPGFQVKNVFLEGGSPFVGGLAPSFTTFAGARVAQPGGQRLAVAAKATRKARTEVGGSSGGAPGLPIGSHMKIQGARRNWLQRSAAMEQALSLNNTYIQHATSSERVLASDDWEHDGVGLNQLLGPASSNNSSTWMDGLRLFVGRVGSVLGLIRKDNRRSHYLEDLDASKRALHPGALVPFDTNPLWINAARDAGTDQWRGYGSAGISAEDGSTAVSAQKFQAAIQGLINLPIGGIELPPGAARKWSWNTPTTGGLTMTIYGMGFGWSPIKCSDECLEDPNGAGNCPLKQCNFLDSSVGDTNSEETAWTSDSSMSMLVPAGIGSDLPVNVTAGRYKALLILSDRFSYDAPAETRISPGNSGLLGNVSVTVYGSNFGSLKPAIQINLGESSCSSAIWSSDSQVVCSKAVPGSGALLDAKVRVQGRPSEDPMGISRVFSYNKPEITGIYPGNAPPGGFKIITLLGINFGIGPNTKLDTRAPSCPQDAPGQSRYILNPRNSREAICGSGFSNPGTKRFQVDQSNSDGTGPLVNLVWDNIRPYSLAQDPIACIINEYLCTYKKDLQYCRNIPDACQAVSNLTAKEWDSEYLNLPAKDGVLRPMDEEHKKWYAVSAGEAGCKNLPPDAKCPWRIISSYIKDGLNCDMMDQTDPQNPEPYFHKNKIFGTDYLCGKSPRPLGGCSRCARLGCCNERGTFGATVSGTECVTLRWMSDSSMACRLAPGIGPGHFVMVAVDDYEGVGVSMKERLFSFDIPVVSTITRGAGPTSGGKSYTVLGSDFGTFACNRTWCSFDADLLRCNATRCSSPGQPDSSALVSHQASLQATYDMSTVFRTACAAIKWTSDTALACTAAPGTGDLRVVELTVFRSYNRWSKELDKRDEDKSFRYHVPTLTVVQPTNLAANSGKNVTIFGHDFGMWDTQPKARMAGTACIETYWVSDTIIKCRAPLGMPPPPCRGVDGAKTETACKSIVCNTCANGRSATSCARPYDTHHQVDGQGICRSVVVTVDRLRGYLTEAFSYEGAQITGLNPTNGPPTGGFNITMQGQSFGDNAEYVYSGQIGESSCSLMAWTSDTAITCSMIMGISFGHVPRINIEWNKGFTRNLEVLFTFDSPKLDKLTPNVIPATGGVQLSIFGSNFGAFPKFEDPASVILPLAPTAKVGDTPCSLTQWYSDSAVVCTILSNGLGPGPGVGGLLPLEVQVGYQYGVYKEPFGFKPPTVKFASAINGPALGGNVLQISGDDFGSYDYTPTAKVGETDCKLTRWQSNTAVQCTVPRCTTYLAGGNLELPLQVLVGLGHRVSSIQGGILMNYYFFDLQKDLPFTLTTNEINLICFSSAFILALMIILSYHAKYRKIWHPPVPNLPERYAKVRADELEKFSMNLTKKVNAPDPPPDDEMSGPDDSEDSDSGFYEFTRASNENKPLKSRGSKDAQTAFQRGQDAAMQMHGGRKYSQITAKDVVTGQPVIYDQTEDDAAAGVGDVEPTIESTPTPLPAAGKKKK